MRELVARARRGDHDAFDALARQHTPELYRLAVAVVGLEGAQDVIQDALVRAWRELPTLRDLDAFLPWTRRIVVNRCRDVVRSRRGVQLLSLELATHSPTPPTATGGVLLATSVPDPGPSVGRSADLAAAIGRLGHDQREVIALHYGADLPLREVARTLGIPAGTAKSRLHGALRRLRETLEDSSDD